MTEAYKQHALSEIQNGNNIVFRQLVEQHQRPVYNMCVRYMGEADAEDVAQDTFIRALLHREKFDPNRSMLSWLLTVARHICIDRLRQRKHLEPIDSQSVAEISSGRGPDEILSEKQQLTIIEETLRSLPEGFRETIMLVDVEGMSYRETADILQVPQGTVMTWLHRGREKLKDSLLKRQHRADADRMRKGAIS